MVEFSRIHTVLQLFVVEISDNLPCAGSFQSISKSSKTSSLPRVFKHVFI